MLTWEIGKYRESPVLCMWNVEAIFQQNLNQKQYKKQQTIIKQTFHHECKCKYKNIIFGEGEEEMDRERNYLNEAPCRPNYFVMSYNLIRSVSFDLYQGSPIPSSQPGLSLQPFGNGARQVAGKSMSVWSSICANGRSAHKTVSSPIPATAGPQSQKA